MNFCPRCGKPLQPGAAFCAFCGQATAVAPAPAAPAQPVGRSSREVPVHVSQVAPAIAVPQKQRGSFPWLAALIALLLIGLACFLLFFQNRNALAKEGNAPPSALAKEEIGMPDDVRAWLEHLKKIEEKKQQITIRQIANLKVFGEMLQTLGPGIGQLDPYGQDGPEGKDPSQVTQGKFQDLRPEWQDLVAQYQSVPPPAPCKTLADTYFKALNEIPAMTGDIIDVLNKVQSNPADALQAATALKAKSYSSVDLGFNEADGQLSAICSKYHTNKWFNIKADVMGGGMLGSSGSLGGGAGGF